MSIISERGWRIFKMSMWVIAFHTVIRLYLSGGNGNKIAGALVFLFIGGPILALLLGLIVSFIGIIIEKIRRSASESTINPTSLQQNSTPKTTIVQTTHSTAQNEQRRTVTTNLESQEKIKHNMNVKVDEDAIYASIWEEIESGDTDKGLWARIFSECNGDERQTKVAYIQRRAALLITAARENTAHQSHPTTEKIQRDDLNNIENINQLNEHTPPQTGLKNDDIRAIILVVIVIAFLLFIYLLANNH